MSQNQKIGDSKVPSRPVSVVDERVFLTVCIPGPGHPSLREELSTGICHDYANELNKVIFYLELVRTNYQKQTPEPSQLKAERGKVQQLIFSLRSYTGYLEQEMMSQIKEKVGSSDAATDNLFSNTNRDSIRKIDGWIDELKKIALDFNDGKPFDVSSFSKTTNKILCKIYNENPEEVSRVGQKFEDALRILFSAS